MSAEKTMPLPSATEASVAATCEMANFTTGLRSLLGAGADGWDGQSSPSAQRQLGPHWHPPCWLGSAPRLQHVGCGLLVPQQVAFGAAARQQHPKGTGSDDDSVPSAATEEQPQPEAQPACNGIARAVSQTRNFDAILPSKNMLQPR